MNIQDFNKKKLRQVPWDAVDMEPGPYCMSYGFTNDSLKRSIAEVGLLNPPLLRQGRGDRLEIVTGYRRSLACRALGWRGITCFDLSTIPLTSLDCLLINFQDNLATRPLNLVEKGMFLKRLGNFLAEENIVKEFMPLLGLSSHIPTLHLLLKMEDFTEEQLQTISNNKLSLPVLKALTEMPSDLEKLTFNWMTKLNFNFNQQLQLIEFINDISLKCGMKPNELFEREGFDKFLDDPKMNKPQKAKLFLEHLQALRFPRLSRAEKTFQEQIAKLHLPKFARIQHSPGFEDEHCKLSIDFKNGTELKQRLLQLSKMENLEKINIPGNED